MDKTVCELFAGVGGFRLGLERADKKWNTVWANQWEPGKTSQHAFDCYCSHFGNSNTHVNEDISTINKKEIPNHNLLVGGFPCQDYSVARTLSGNTGINGKKGVLWWDIYEILKVKKPPFVLLENVDRLLKSPASQRGRDFGIILACFNKLGYNVEWRIINAADYGFAQRRRRTFIFAYSKNTSYYKRVSSFNPIEIINKEGFFAKTFKVEKVDETNINDTEIDSKDLATISESFKFAFENSGCLISNTIYTCTTTPKYKEPIPMRDILQSDVEKKYYLGKDLEKWKYLKGAKKINRTSKNGHEYVFSEGPIAFPDPINKPARTMLTSEASTNRSTHIIEDPQTKKLRKITPLEAERIQGFEDEWTSTGMPESFRYFCMGNALVVGLITEMGKQLNKIFKDE